MIKHIKEILNRNKKVELDKAWETSKTRRIIIAFLTYFVVVIFLFFIQVPNPWLNALVPTIGFILSTLTLSFFKRIWISYFYKN